jgi:hypothetical protein
MLRRNLTGMLVVLTRAECAGGLEQLLCSRRLGGPSRNGSCVAMDYPIAATVSGEGFTGKAETFTRARHFLRARFLRSPLSHDLFLEFK